MKRLLLALVFPAAISAQSWSGQSSGDGRVVPPYRFCVGPDNGSDVCMVLSSANVAKLLNGSLDFALTSVTVATLPPAVLSTARVYRVTDGTSTGDCSNGGGTATAVCISNGASWQSFGSGGGGGGSSSLSGLTSATSSNTLTNGLNPQIWNWGALNGNDTAFQIGESAPSTGSNNILFRVTTAPVSNSSPFQADPNGNGIALSNTGFINSVGNGGVNFSALTNIPSACSANQFANGLTNVAIQCAQPAFTNLSGIASAAQIPNPAGDVTNTYAATQVTGLHFGASGLPLGTAPTNGQCIGNATGTIQGVSCSGVAAGSNLSIQYNNSTAFGGIPVPTSPNGVPQLLCSTPSGGVGVLATFCLQGVPVNPQTGTSYTIAATDRGSVIKANNASAQTYTATNPSTSGFGSNFPYLILNKGTGTITENASGFNIDGNSSTIIPPNWNAWHWSDNTNLFTLRVPDFGVFPNCTGGTSALTFVQATGVFGCQTGLGGGNSTSTNTVSNLYLSENFCGGLKAEGLLGALGWFVDITGSSSGIIERDSNSASDANHPCGLSLVTGATNTNYAAMLLQYCGDSSINVSGCSATPSPSTAGNIVAINSGSIFDNTWVIKPIATTSERFTVGWEDWSIGGFLTTGAHKNQIIVRFDTAVPDSNLVFEVCDSTPTCTDSTTNSFAPTAGDWIKIRIRSTVAGTILFSACQNAGTGGCTLGAETSISTNVPSTLMIPAIGIVTYTNAARTLVGNFFSSQQTVNR